MSERKQSLPKSGGRKAEEPQEEEVQETEDVNEEVEENEESKKISKEESDHQEKVFFEEDDSVRLRDGMTYKIPPLSLKDARTLMKKLNTIDTSVIISNMIEDEEGNDTYNDLLEVLLLGFKPYYPTMTIDYLEDYIDLSIAKKVIDTLIGLNDLKKSM